MKRLLMLAMVTVAVAGCGAKGEATAQPSPTTTASVSAAPPAKPSTVDACALVSKEEAELLVGTALNPASPAHQSCTYTGPPTGPAAQVEVFVGDGAKKFYETEVLLNHKLDAVPGIGDEAHVEADAVFFRKSEQWVAIRFVRIDDLSKYREKLEKLARMAADRIRG